MPCDRQPQQRCGCPLGAQPAAPPARRAGALGPQSLAHPPQITLSMRSAFCCSHFWLSPAPPVAQVAPLAVPFLPALGVFPAVHRTLTLHTAWAQWGSSTAAASLWPSSSAHGLPSPCLLVICSARIARPLRASFLISFVGACRPAGRPALCSLCQPGGSCMRLPILYLLKTSPSLAPPNPG